MPPIILSEYESVDRSIITQTSLGNCINNQQEQVLLKSEDLIYQSFQESFESVFQGKSNPIYNCHGLTFASRRTGIYKVSEINKILDDEYVQIKSEKDVIEGDIAVYLDTDQKSIIHTGIVTFVDRAGLLPDIKILSKILKGKEIVHRPHKGPYYKGHIKYYRIEHQIEIRIYT